MPFQSEKQRRYLWANEPEIARDWTDTYGSGIAKALGGRIPYQWGGPGGKSPGTSAGPGPGGQGGRGGDNRGRDPTPSRPGPDRHPPAPTAPYDDRIQRIAAQDQRTAALRTQQLQDMRDPNYGQFLRPSPLIEKPTFGMRLRSGLGALGRGLGNLGNMAMWFNPYTAALGLAGKARLGTMFNIGSRYANQGGNFLNEFRQYNTIADYLNRNKSPLDASGLFDEEQAGIMHPDILPEPKYDNMFDNTYLAQVLNRNEKTELGILKTQQENADTFGPLNEKQKQRMNELLEKEKEGSLTIDQGQYTV